MAVTLNCESAALAKRLFIFGLDPCEVAEVLAVPVAALTDECHPTQAEIQAYAERDAARRQRINAARRKYLASSPSNRIANAVRARLWAALKGRTDGALFSRLSYSADELVAHLENQFLPGMSWDNYGAWHVDHIQPCAAFDQQNPQQFASCWALSNLRPLWAADNIKKGASRG
ncbi:MULTISPECIES: hypothetical protein [Xanthomonas]|uniref:HNH endonuclease n=1 Tax=Xanthomonas dyei TaxID=743699 RepID=A0ABZ0D3F4_9XANT|nr:hypothetical protein [Xanthomonas dyei]WOB24759.1 hypothetical protein NYR99_13215 [Xanthomonas dyei]WOB52387.1 hypothetical protein NYR95_13220 [Xanthomonas dyei]